MYSFYSDIPIQSITFLHRGPPDTRNFQNTVARVLVPSSPSIKISPSIEILFSNKRYSEIPWTLSYISRISIYYNRWNYSASTSCLSKYTFETKDLEFTGNYWKKVERSVVSINFIHFTVHLLPSISCYRIAKNT